MLIPLVCTQCGGKLEVDQTSVFESGNIFIVSSDQMLTCPHCETKYISGEKINRFVEKITISINGDLNGGNIIIGNGVIINNNSDSKATANNEGKKMSN